MTTRHRTLTVSLALLLGATSAACTTSDGDPGPTGSPSSASETGAATGRTTDVPSGSGTTTTGTPSSPPTPTDVPAAKPSVGTVGVLISTAGWEQGAGVVVRGYADTIDPVATCTLELTRAGTTRTTTTDALEGPTTMSCGELVIPPADVATGDWTATLTYASSTAHGVSDPVVVTVP